MNKRERIQRYLGVVLIVALTFFALGRFFYNMAMDRPQNIIAPMRPTPSPSVSATGTSARDVLPLPTQAAPDENSAFLKKFTLAVSFGVLALVAVSFLFIADPPQSEIAQASEAQNVIGHAWSENIGWVSFNCMNQDKRCANNTGILCELDSDCVAAGVGGTCLNECSASNYGVNVSESGGPFSGYAWSSNVGWIDFAPVGPYPGTPNNAATYNAATGAVTGWTKIVNLGDDGWLQLSGTWTNGVSIQNLTFTGWAWNGTAAGSGTGHHGIVASNGVLHESILALIRETVKK